MTDDSTMIFFNRAIQADRVSVHQPGTTPAESAILEKLHGILSLLLFDQVARMNQANRG